MNPIYFLVMCGFGIVVIQKTTSNMEANLDSTTSLTQYVTNYALHSTLRVLRLATTVFAVSLLLVIAILFLIQGLGGVTSSELTNAINAANLVRDVSNRFNMRANIFLFALSVVGLLADAYRTAKMAGQQSVLRMLHLEIQQSRTELDEMLEFFMGKVLLDKIRNLSQYIFIVTLFLLIPATLGMFAPSIGQSVDYKEIELQNQMVIVKSNELNKALTNQVQLLKPSKSNLTPADEKNIGIIVNAYYSVFAQHYNLPVDPYLLRMTHEKLVRIFIKRVTAAYAAFAPQNGHNMFNGVGQVVNLPINIMETGDLSLQLAEIEKRSPGFLEKLKLSLSKIAKPEAHYFISSFIMDFCGQLLRVLSANQSADHVMVGTIEKVTMNNPSLSFRIVNQQNAFLLAALQGYSFSESIDQAFGSLDTQYEMINKMRPEE